MPKLPDRSKSLGRQIVTLPLRPQSTEELMNSDVSAVKALVFDVFGTTVDWRTSIIEEAQAFGARKGITVFFHGIGTPLRG
jgi:hypothetical protein